MKKFTKRSISVATIGFLTAVLALVLPSLYLTKDNSTVMGFITTFGGTIKYNSYDARIGFSVPLFIAWLLPLIGGGISLAFGKNQKSAFFFSMICFIASGILYALTMKYVLSINVAGSISGFQSAEMCAQPYVAITLNAIGVIACLFGIFYKPSTRYSRYR